jgi:hypothetical protein
MKVESLIVVEPKTGEKATLNRGNGSWDEFVGTGPGLWGGGGSLVT